MNTNLSKPFEYIKQSFKTYFEKDNFLFFAKIMVVVVAAKTLLNLVSDYFYPTSMLDTKDFSNIYYLLGFIFLSLLGVLITLYSNSIIFTSVLNIGTKEKEVFTSAWKRLLVFSGLSLLLLVMFIPSLVLLILPALILMSYFYFSLFIILEKKVSIIKALKESRELAKGKMWKVVGRIFIIGFVNFFIQLIASLVPYISFLVLPFIAPLTVLPMYFLYKDLVRNS